MPEHVTCSQQCMKLAGQTVVIATIDHLRKREKELWKRGRGNSPSAVHSGMHPSGGPYMGKGTVKIYLHRRSLDHGLYLRFENLICDALSENKMSTESLV